MKIYTGYFGKISNYHKNKLFPVSIALYQPKWLDEKVDEIKELTPRYNMLKMDEDIYTQEYQKILSRIDIEELLYDLERLSNGNDVVLLCWEKPGFFCHRKLVSKWINENSDYEVREYVDYDSIPRIGKPKNIKPKSDIEQLDLF